jgi:hypothetical protein
VTHQESHPFYLLILYFEIVTPVLASPVNSLLQSPRNNVQDMQSKTSDSQNVTNLNQVPQQHKGLGNQFLLNRSGPQIPLDPATSLVTQSPFTLNHASAQMKVSMANPALPSHIGRPDQVILTPTG